LIGVGFWMMLLRVELGPIVRYQSSPLSWLVLQVHLTRLRTGWTTRLPARRRWNVIDPRLRLDHRGTPVPRHFPRQAPVGECVRHVKALPRMNQAAAVQTRMKPMAKSRFAVITQFRLQMLNRRFSIHSSAPPLISDLPTHSSAHVAVRSPVVWAGCSVV